MKILNILTEKRKIGNIGERAAAKFLKKEGYRIIKKNYVALGNEIDIIARRGDITAFVEVKARSVKSIGAFEPRPASAVTADKQAKIIKAASYFKAYEKGTEKMRFDVIEVYLDDNKVVDVKHLTAAFTKDTARKRNHAKA